MVKIGAIIVVAGIFISIGVAFLFYGEESFREVKVSSWGEPIMVGGVNFDVQYVTNYDFLEKTQDRKEWEKKQVEEFGIMEPTKEKPDGTFFQIQITAENTGNEIVKVTGGQFHLYDINDKNLALLIALESSFCFFLETPVILLGIIFPFSVMYLDKSLISL